MKRNTVLGEDEKVGIGRIIEESSCQKSARCRDECGRRSVGSLRRDKSPSENTTRGARDVHSGIRMDVDVVQIGGGAVEEAIPKRSKM